MAVAVKLGSAAFFCCLAFGVSAMELTLSPDGNVRIGPDEHPVLRPTLFLKGWRHVKIVGDYYGRREPGSARITAKSDGSEIMRGTVALKRLADGKARIDYRFSVVKPFQASALGCETALPAGKWSGLPWRVDDIRGVFSRPADGGIALARRKCRSVAFSTGGGNGAVQLSSENEVDCLVQDNRKWQSTYSIRLCDTPGRIYAPGDVVAFSYTVSAREPLTVECQKPTVIRAGDGWTAIDYKKDIREGSALDFSHMGFADAPAGKYGWLRNAGGHFEFEKRPGKTQRFYGVNLCYSANFPSADLSDRLMARLRRLGYNAIRVHHQDGETVKGSGDGLTLNRERMARLDRMMAAAFREGLYVTTDLYVSRGVAWRQIGVDRDGEIDIQLFKALCAVYEPAFENWKAYAKNFLLHVNPHTGRRYIDEPALPLLSLVNEGGFFMCWGAGGRNDPILKTAWKDWIRAKRAADPSFYPSVSADEMPDNIWAGPGSAAAALFMGECEAKMVSRMCEFLRELGCKALLTNDNCGPHFAPLQAASGGYDYVDDHFYVDHPNFIDTPWRLPSRCPNVNPIIGGNRLAPSPQAFTRVFGKPFTVSEWNFSGPGRYRGVGGILTGAMAALQDWDGLWRFTYSHTEKNLHEAHIGPPGYFDLAGDPLSQASERASVCLFLRGDIEPLTSGAALLITPESLRPPGAAFKGAPDWCDAAWKMRVGTCLSENDAGGLRVIRRESGEVPGMAEPEAGASSRNGLSLDRVRGAFVIATPRTCGGFAPSGSIEAGDLTVTLEDAAATVWVHALDYRSVPRSRRLLLTHLTDVQGDGATFADQEMTVLVKWGGRPVVRNGKAHISLRLDQPSGYDVYELDTSGRRVATVPATAGNDRLRFTADVEGSRGARILYEIVAR